MLETWQSNNQMVGRRALVKKHKMFEQSTVLENAWLEKRQKEEKETFLKEAVG